MSARLPPRWVGPTLVPKPLPRCGVLSLDAPPSVARGRRGRAARPAGGRLRRPASPRLRRSDKKCYVSACATGPSPSRSTAPTSWRSPWSTSSSTTCRSRPRPAPAQPQADANGELNGTVGAPFIASGQRFFTLQLVERRRTPLLPVQFALKGDRAVGHLLARQAAQHEHARALPRARVHRPASADLRALRVQEQGARDRADRRQALRRLRAVLRAPAPVPVQEPARRQVDRPVRPGAGLQPEGARVHAADDRREPSG